MVRVSKVDFGALTYVKALIVMSSQSHHSLSAAWHPRVKHLRSQRVCGQEDGRQIRVW